MINSVTPSQVTPDTAAATSGSEAVRPQAAPAADTGAPTATGEAVTVSADANTTTQLLGAARGADGMDQEAVQSLRSAVQNGTYSVSPEDLARAITSAAKEAAS